MGGKTEGAVLSSNITEVNTAISISIVERPTKQAGTMIWVIYV